MAAAEPPVDEDGRIKVGSYRLIRALGTGGMSSVFRAAHAETGYEVALKVLPRTMAKNPAVLQRFMREARNAEALEHPNIVAIYDRGVDQGRHYLVLEYIDGGDFHERVRSRGPLGVPEAVEVARAVAKALKYAAGRQVIHRDVKPANILVTNSGAIKVADLGLAIQAEADDERVTRDGTTVGTVDYMAPEQARDSRAATIQSDMYSLGCTLYFLLTGTPPFGGGDVAERLSRHFQQPAPDVRQVRPDVPGRFAALILRLMAKKPADRFEDYDDLIEALDEIAGVRRAGEPPEPATLDALIDDEEDHEASDGGEIGLIGLEDDAPPRPPPPKPVPARPQPSARRPKVSEPRPKSEPIPEWARSASLAELAALDADDGPPAREPRHTASTRLLDDDEVEPVAVIGGWQTTEPAPAEGKQTSIGVFVAVGLAVGFAAVLLVVGLRMAGSGSTPAPEELVDEAPESPAAVVDRSPQPSPPAPVVVKNLNPIPPDRLPKPPSPPPEPPWVEPVDRVVVVPPEPRLSTDRSLRVLPSWIKTAPAAVESGRSLVRRAAATGEERSFRSLREAFDTPADVVEVADDGPFFEDGPFRVVGNDRRIVARGGYRPILALRSDTKAQPGSGIVQLEKARLVLEGLDLVVQVRDDEKAAALVRCLNSELILRDCTVTVVNGSRKPFPTIQAGDQSARGRWGPSRAWLDRSLLRSSSPTTIEVASCGFDLAVTGSVLVNGPGPLIDLGIDAGQPRRVASLRSVLGSHGQVFSADVRRGPTSPARPVVRVAETTLARIGSGPDPGLIAIQEALASGQAVASFDWEGEENTFAGWSSWMVAGPGNSVAVAGLDAARSAWAKSDIKSKSRPETWSVIPDRVEPSNLEPLAAEQAPTLARVAAPTPHLRRKALERFYTLPVPSLVAELRRAPVSKTALAPGTTGFTFEDTMKARPTLRGRSPEFGNNNPDVSQPAPTSPGTPKAGRPAAPGEQVLEFDANADPWRGDLGRFIAEKLDPKATRVRVLAAGSYARTTSALKMPTGVSLTVEVAPTPPGAIALSWTGGAKVGEAVFEVNRADLVLVGVDLSAASGTGPKHLLRVTDGHLVLVACRLASASSTPENSALIAFLAPGTRPEASRPGVFITPTNLPTCLVVDSTLMAQRAAIRAELGRGVVKLTNCAVAAEDAFELVPSKVARASLEADLQLERCTVAAERSFVRLAAWPGSRPGPDRPWLVASQDCAFLDAFDRPYRTSAMLVSEPDGLGQGALTWQADRDDYEVLHFLASTAVEPTRNPRPDVRRDWVDFWGPGHVGVVFGPVRSRGNPSARFLADKLTPGTVQPGDLALDPDFPADSHRNRFGADLDRMGIAPTFSRFHPAKNR